jgi:hypothetical protein
MKQVPKPRVDAACSRARAPKRTRALSANVALLALALTACGNGAPSSADAAQLGAGRSAVPTAGRTASDSAGTPEAVGGKAGNASAAPDGAGHNAAGVAGAAGVASTTSGRTGDVEDAGPGGASAGTGATNGRDGMNALAHAKPKCMKKPSQVVVVGDSYITWVSHNLPQDLQHESGVTWRMKASGGCSLGSGGGCLSGEQIPVQLDHAIADDPDIIAALMDGGGNDILVPDTTMFPGSDQCKNSEMAPTIQACKDIVTTALEAGKKMMFKFADTGARDVVYFYYPRTPDGTLIGGSHPNAILEYSLPMAKAFCDSAVEQTNGRVRCHFIDMIPVFEGHPEYFAPTDIHPSPMGSAAMAKVIWKTMKDNCIAQPESSGCCEP